MIISFSLGKAPFLVTFRKLEFTLSIGFVGVSSKIVCKIIQP